MYWFMQCFVIYLSWVKVSFFKPHLVRPDELVECVLKHLLSGFKSTVLKLPSTRVSLHVFGAIKPTRSSCKSSETNILHWQKNKSEEKLKRKFRISKMSYRLCMNIFGIALAFLIVTLSSRISEEIRKGEMLRTGVRLLHLFSFGTWMGIQFWVTFIAGE